MMAKGVVKFEGEVLIDNVDFTLFDTAKGGCRSDWQGDFRLPLGTSPLAVFRLAREGGPFDLVLNDGRSAPFSILRASTITPGSPVLIHLTQGFD